MTELLNKSATKAPATPALLISLKHRKKKIFFSVDKTWKKIKLNQVVHPISVPIYLFGVSVSILWPQNPIKHICPNILVEGFANK